MKNCCAYHKFENFLENSLDIANELDEVRITLGDDENRNVEMTEIKLREASIHLDRLIQSNFRACKNEN